jgi:hypothetical protein
VVLFLDCLSCSFTSISFFFRSLIKLKTYLDTDPFMSRVFHNVVGKDVSNKLYQIQELLLSNPDYMKTLSSRQSSMVNLRIALVTQNSSDPNNIDIQHHKRLMIFLKKIMLLHLSWIFLYYTRILDTTSLSILLRNRHSEHNNLYVPFKPTPKQFNLYKGSPLVGDIKSLSSKS